MKEETCRKAKIHNWVHNVKYPRPMSKHVQWRVWGASQTVSTHERGVIKEKSKGALGCDSFTEVLS